MTKLLKQVYKSYEGARKRAAFENGVAPSEFKQGYKAKLYHYSVVAEGDHWRVQRSTAPAKVQVIGVGITAEFVTKMTKALNK